MSAIRYAFSLTLIFSVTLAFAQDRVNPKERNFQTLKERAVREFKGTPVKGDHKRMRRAMHFLKRHLDENGNVFNHVLANMEALEQLYIDTFPAVIEGDWQHIGPLNSQGTGFMEEGLGRVNQIHFASNLVWYAGTAGGGLWRTDLAGLYVQGGPYPWYPLTDSLPSIAISGIETHPNDVDEVYILTGDGDGSNTFSSRGTQPGVGILHSTDGGTTWEPTALQYPDTNLQAGYKLIRYPGSVDTMFAACTDSLFLTTDGWNSYTTPVALQSYDIEFKPNDPQTIYIACLGSLQRSTTGINGFVDITANLVQTSITPNSLMGRMAIAVTPDDPNFLYVIISETRANGSGLLSFQFSTDAGNSFVETINQSYNILAADDPLTTGTGQGNYDLSIWADPGNANTVIVGGVNLWKSNSAGGVWEQIMHWENSPPEYTHADIHAIESLNGNIVVGSDGGLYLSEDGGYEWFNRGRGLGITQYYHFDVYVGLLDLPYLLGGAQDNGTSAGIGFADNVFEMAGGGDGFRCFQGIYDGNLARYRSVQNGKLYFQVYAGGDFWIEDGITPDPELNGQDQGMGAWDTPYQPSPINFNDVIAGYDDLYFSTDNGDDWAMLPVNHPSGSYDGSELISQIAWSKNNSNVVYFSIADGAVRHLWRCDLIYAGVITSDLDFADCTVIALDTIPNMAPNSPSDIALNPYNDEEIWLTFPDYNDSMKVFYNPNLPEDSVWINISYNLPNVPVHCAAWDVDGILVGTDIGAFFLPHGTDEWVYYSQGLPTVGVSEIEIHNTILGKKVFASTWGRGIWYASPPVPPRQTRWYVDSSATGLNTGANWANAFPDLQTALDTILPGDSIWVAKGAYYPDSLVGFHLPFNDVFIWGGFAGTEDSVHQRDFNTNHTILSGDIGFAGDSTDNTHHVFMFDGQNGNVLLDGFHITEGNADGPQEASKGGGIYYATNHQNGKPIIRNCKIYNNTALGGSGLPQHHGAGAGMYILDSDVGDTHMYVYNCTFENNNGYEGGGLYVDCERMFLFMVQSADTGTADVHLINCQFDGNEAFARGGGLFMEAGKAGTVALTMDSVAFDGNRIGSGNGNGGAIYGDAKVSTPGVLELELSNTTFNDHDISAEGGAIYIDGEGASTEWIFNTCTFSNNSSFAGGALFNYYPGVDSESGLIFNDCSFTNNSASSGGAIQMNGISRASAEAHFKRCTLNNNSASVRGGAIFFNGDTGGSFTVTIDSTVFCNNTAGENGAIRAYFRRLTNNPEPDGLGDFTITHSKFDSNSTTDPAQGGAIVFWCDGAYVSASISETDFTANSTGTLGGAVAFVHQANDTSTLAATFDDCDFLNNTAPFGNGDFGGGALFLDKMDATLTDCSFTGNQGKNGGAVTVRAETKAKTYTHLYSNCLFKANTGSGYGGALSVEHNSPATLDINIVLTAFDSNYTTSVLANEGFGGAIYHVGTGRCESEITNSAFLDNYGSTEGGAIYAAGLLSSPMDTLIFTVDSCIFVNNDAGTTEGSVELFGHNMRIESSWTACHFFNEPSGPIFQNRADGSGYAEATFRDCTINLIPPPEPPAAPAPAPAGQQNNPP